MTRPLFQLFHYTCSHGAEKIGAPLGRLIPHAQPTLGGLELLWLTPARRPDARQLGLTSNYLSCDRTEHAYTVLSPVEVHPWSWWRPRLARKAVQALEGARGTRPDLWWATENEQIGRLLR